MAEDRCARGGEGGGRRNAEEVLWSVSGERIKRPSGSAFGGPGGWPAGVGWKRRRAEAVEWWKEAGTALRHLVSVSSLNGATAPRGRAVSVLPAVSGSASGFLARWDVFWSPFVPIKTGCFQCSVPGVNGYREDPQARQRSTLAVAAASPA